MTASDGPGTSASVELLSLPTLDPENTPPTIGHVLQLTAGPGDSRVFAFDLYTGEVHYFD